MSTNRQIFLCHASEDKERVREIYDLLKKEGFDPWLDEENILPGQNWEEEIPRALRGSAAVLLFLSRTSVRKRGYVQKEFRLAFDALQEMPSGQVFAIPLRLDNCEVPEMFRHLQWSDLHKEDAITQVFESLRRHVPEEEKEIPQEDRSIAGAADRRALSSAYDLDALKERALNGDTPKVRQNALRAIARRQGKSAAEWLAQYAWSSRYSAARCEAIEQVVNLMRREAVEWLQEVVESHPDKSCRSIAAEHVLKLEGLNLLKWALVILLTDEDYSVQHALSSAIYQAANSQTSPDTPQGPYLDELRQALSRAIGDVARERLLATFLLLCQRQDQDKELALTTAAQADSVWAKSRCLALVLRIWPDHKETKDALAEIANSSRGWQARVAKELLQIIEKKEVDSLDSRLDLKARF